MIQETAGLSGFHASWRSYFGYTESHGNEEDGRARGFWAVRGARFVSLEAFASRSALASACDFDLALHRIGQEALFVSAMVQRIELFGARGATGKGDLRS